MKLLRLNYYHFIDKPKEWAIENFTFGDINLIVGKNATGKSRILTVINSLSSLLTAPNKRIVEANWDVHFQNGAEPIDYKLNISDREVKEEKLLINNQEVLKRDASGKGEIYFREEKKPIGFQISPDKVAAFSKRDTYQHPFLDYLFDWGNNVLFYPFSSSLGRGTLDIIPQDSTEKNIDLKNYEQVIEKFNGGINEFGKEYKQMILDDMYSIGYKLEDINIAPLPGVKIEIQPPLPVSLPSPPMALFVKEPDIKFNIPQTEISQGMFRALSILIQLNYGLLSGTPNCILIDDIGEGLDYERASSLINILMGKAIDSSVQLIMATNDRFVMNKVPIEYWIILQRDGGKCNNYDYRNSKDLFDEFELTGLNNFDLFSSNYYLKGELGE